jgi:hypothetical protein
VTGRGRKSGKDDIPVASDGVSDGSNPRDKTIVRGKKIIETQTSYGPTREELCVVLLLFVVCMSDDGGRAGKIMRRAPRTGLSGVGG